MTVSTSKDVTTLGEAGKSGLQPRRGPPKAIKVLMPVWGHRYVQQFLEFCMPTLLAPGNIPGLAEQLPCEFVLMTSQDDAAAIAAHPAWRYLSRICSVQLRSIDDLITDGNHTATITLAFARAVRESGDAMLDTCFLFLVSDYLVAEGSLVNVFARIRDGASGVVAGNFQIVAEDAIPLLRRNIDPSSPYLSLPPRDLVKWSLRHLHPATVANIVNFNLNHNVHTNRLFWSVDDETLIGRFYLMHMIAIRPETTDFVIGSSCDYSFIPEMCPSNNVVAMTDSDEYLVVEMQPRNHERHHLRWGAVITKELANSLSEWTTAQHRANVGYSLVYHGDDIPAKTTEIIAQADTFIAEVNRQLAPNPHPHRNHHYWIGSIASHRFNTRQAMTARDWNFILGSQIERHDSLTRRLWRLRLTLFGSPPEVSKWHPRWLDYQVALRTMERLTPSNGRLLVVADRPIGFAHWLSHLTKDVYTLETERLLELSRQLYMPLVGAFDTCMMFLSERELDEGNLLLGRVQALLKPGGHVVVVAINDRDFGEAALFSQSFGFNASKFMNLDMTIAEVHYIPSNWWRWGVQRSIVRIGRGAMTRPKIFLPWTIAASGILALASRLTNWSMRTAQPTPPASDVCSSVLMALQKADTPVRLPEFKPERGYSHMGSFGSEDAYQRYLQLRDEFGLEALGLRANQIWHDDPKELVSLLARYKFVAKLLSERHDVAEYGCRDAFGTRIVLQEVKKITVYDDDPILIDDVMRRYRGDWPLDAHVHDLMISKLPKPHDSIYCLDVIQNISREYEDVFIGNLVNSLGDENDILIIGCQSYEYAASHASRALFKAVRFPTREVVGSQGETGPGVGPGTVKAPSLGSSLVPAMSELLDHPSEKAESRPDVVAGPAGSMTSSPSATARRFARSGLR